MIRLDCHDNIMTRSGVDKVKPKVWFKDAGILIMMQQVRLMMFSLDIVDYSIFFLLLST